MKKNQLAYKILLYVMGGLLLVFTGYRTVDLVSRTMPKEAALLSIIAIVAFDGGIVAWLYYNRGGAKSFEQVLISGTMVVIDFVGMGILFVSHILLNETFYVQSSTTIFYIGVIAVWSLAIGVLVNVGALLAIHFYDPDEILARAQRDAEAEILSQAVEMVRSRTKELATNVAPGLAADTLNKARAGRERVPVSLPRPVARPQIEQAEFAKDAEEVALRPKTPQIVKRGVGRPKGSTGGNTLSGPLA